jgi:hypothetical protein
MNWKTCSVEAGGGIGKRYTTKHPADRLPNIFQQSVSGMQKHGLTMFAATCYSGLVPRVHPGLLCAVSFWRDGVRKGLRRSYREMRFRMKCRFGDIPR